MTNKAWDWRSAFWDWRLHATHGPAQAGDDSEAAVRDVQGRPQSAGRRLEQRRSRRVSYRVLELAEGCVHVGRTADSTAIEAMRDRYRRRYKAEGSRWANSPSRSWTSSRSGRNR